MDLLKLCQTVTRLELSPRERLLVDDQIERLHEVLRQLQDDPRPNIQVITEWLAGLMQASFAVCNSYDGRNLKAVAAWNLPTQYDRTGALEGQICFEIMEQAEGEIRFMRRLRESRYAQTDSNIRSCEIQACLAVPLTSRRGPLGSLCLFYDRDVSDPTELELALAGPAISQLIVQVQQELVRCERARTHIHDDAATSTDASRREAERTAVSPASPRAEYGVDSPPEDLQALLDASPDKLYLTDGQGRVLAANLQAAASVGLTRESLVGHALFGLHGADLASGRKVKLREAVRTGRPVIIEEERDTHGLETTIVPVVKTEGGRQRAAIIVRDRSSLAPRFDAESTAEIPIEAFLNLVDLHIWTLNSADTCVHANRARARFLGIPQEELVSRRVRDVLGPAEAETALARNELAFQRLKTEREDEEATDSLGQVRILSVSRTPIPEPTGTIRRVVCTALDVTEERNRERTFKHNAALHRQLFESAGIIQLLLDASTGDIIDANTAASTFYQWTPSELLHMNYRDLSANPRERSVQGLAQAVDEHGEPAHAVHRDSFGQSHEVQLYTSPVEVSGRELVHVILFDVTQRKLMESSLRESEEKYRTVVESIAEGYYEADLAGKLVFANSRAVEILGRPGMEPGGIHLRKVLDQAGAENASELLDRVLESGESGRIVDCTLFRPDGTRGTVTISASLARDDSGRPLGFRGIISDTTAQRQTEETVRRQALVFDTVDEGVMVTDSDGHVMDWNPGATRIFGITGHDMLGRSAAGLFSPPDGDEEFMSRIIEAASTKDRWVGEVPLRAADKVQGVCEAAVVPLRDEQARAMAVVWVLRDITERKRLEDMVLQNVRLAAVGELAGGLAHRFNNMLQILMGAAHLANTNLDLGSLGEVKTNLRQILDHCREGGETVKSLQDFARVGTDTSVSTGAVFDLSRVVGQAIKMSQPWWKTHPEKNSIDITLESSLMQGCYVFGKEHELCGSVVNLIKNAAEALSDGGRIVVRGYRAGDDVYVEVEDDGIGIPPENRTRIFEPFFTTKTSKGSGLGLSSIYGIVKQHEGDIRVESEPGQGTTMRLRIPLAASPDLDEETGISPQENFRCRILVIDDFELVVTQLQDGLRKRGQSVLTALSGSEGLQLYAENPVDVIVSDLGMPDMNGWEVGKAVKEMCAKSGGVKTPFILLTGWRGQLDEEGKIAESGVDRVVEKPISVDDLLAIIIDLVSQSSHLPRKA